MSLYDELCKFENIKIGWHLARRGLKDNFIKDPFLPTIWGCNLDDKLHELRRKLLSGEYRFSELLTIEVPKGGLSSRPGTTMIMEDSIVLNTIIYLIIEKLNNKLPETVYSYRLKSDWKKYTTQKDRSIFLESTTDDVPFLKKSTIYKKYISYDEWYVSWIEFDRITQIVLQDKSYRYLGVSDIAAYFENIDLMLLKSMILEEFPKERKLINFLFNALNLWTISTDEGEKVARGLPQGGSIFSCLGNIFLFPIDCYFMKVENIKYYRYMDDIKIFANDRQIIIKNLLRLTRELRKLHLNVQTAKTKVFDEHQKEISRSFFSLKMDLLNKLDTSIGNYNNLDKQKKSKYASELEKIIMGNDRKKFKTTKELSPLDFRAFLRYISMSCALQNKACINKFFSQIKLNMDLKLLNKLSGICRSFSSRHRLLERNILDLIRNYNLFYYQTAKCLESLRCLNSISDETLQYVWETLLNSQIHFYVRMQAAYLLISHPLSQAQQEDLYELFLDEKSSQVRHAVLFLLLKWKNDKAFINDLISLPDQYISKVGTFLSNLQKEYTYTKNSLSHFLKQGNINVFLPMLYVIANSNDKKIKRLLKQKLENVDCNKIFPICLRKEVKLLKTKLCPY